MRLIHNRYDIEFEFIENTMYGLVIENPMVFTEIAEELFRQCEDDEGGFILSENNKLLSVSKTVSFIINPFSLEWNSKKILTKLYNVLYAESHDKWSEEQMALQCSYVNFMDTVCMSSEYTLLYGTELDIQEIFKIGKLRIDVEKETLLEKISEYIYLANKLLGIKIFAFLNLKGFLTQEELIELYKDCCYRKIYLLLLEARYSTKTEWEKICILDKDKCIIYP